MNVFQPSNHVADLRLLKEAAAWLARCPELSSGLRGVLEDALGAVGASQGLLSLFFAEEQELRAGASIGLEPTFLKMFAEVPSGAGACGACLRKRARVVVTDTEVDPIFEAYREIARTGGFRACHSVPIFNSERHLLGVLTATYQATHEPDEREQHLLDLFAQITGEFIQRMQAEEDARNIGGLPEQNTAAVIRVSAKGAVIYANWNSKPLLRLWKSGLGEAIPAHLQDWVNGVLEHGKSRQIEENCGGRTFSITAVPFPELHYVTLYAFDVTERRQAEADLRKNREQLRLFIEQVPVALAMFDREMRYLAASDRWVADYQLPKDIVGRPHYELFPDLPERWKAVHKRALAGEVLRREEDCFTRADGKVQWEKWEVRPWKDANGEIGGILISTENISRRKTAEQSLQNREQELTLIFSNVSDVLFYIAVEPKGVFRFVNINEAFLLATGLKRDQVLGRTVQEVIPEPSCSMVLEKYRQALQTGETVRWKETSDYPAGQKTGLVSVTALLEQDGSCRYLIGTVQDITPPA